MMAGTEIEWVIVQSAYASRDIGAIGFIGDTAVVAVSFFDDSDWNEDGKLSPIERVGKYIPIVGGLFFKKGRAVTQVVMAARGNPDVVLRDSTFNQEAAKQFLDFATSLVFTGIYIVYFSRAVKITAKGAAGAMTDSVVKQYVIRKGMEKMVKAAYDSSMKTGTALR
jgi:hypothetical protein